MKNERLIFGLLLISVFLLNIGYQFQSFSVNASQKPSKNSNQNTSYSISTPKIISQQTMNTKTDRQSDPNYNLGTQEQRINQNNVQSNKLSTTTISSLNTVTVTSNQVTYNSTWYNKDWSYRKNITIDHTKFTANETNFPLLLDFYDKDLKLALTNGFDILFTDSLNNKLPYERIIFNKYYSSTDAHLRVWVKGNWSTKGNTIFMYFGNPFSPGNHIPSRQCLFESRPKKSFH